MRSWLSAQIEYLLTGAEPPVSSIILLATAPMFLGWGGAYVLIILKCFRDKAYGLPMAAICLNISWEATYAFDPPASYPDLLQYGNMIWVFPDSVILYQLLRYGREQQRYPFLRRFYHPILGVLLAFSWFAVRGFRDYFNDPYGLATAWILAALSALTFIPFASARSDNRGLSYPAAWLMLLGNIISAVFCYFWWPLQFSSGRLENEPSSFAFLYLFYVFVPCFNLAHVWILHERRQSRPARFNGA